jgi:hypothetical protein
MCHMRDECIKALDDIIKRKNVKTVLEYGGGESTLFFSKRVEKVYTVEHNLKWVRQADNVIHILTLNKDEYVRAMGVEANLTLIDGIYRKECYERIKGTRTIICIHDYPRDKGFYEIGEHDRYGSLSISKNHCVNVR